MDITSLLSISLGAILVNNFILVQFLGICPFMGVSKKMDTAVGMGFAVIFVMGLASALCYPVNLLLEALDMEFMQTVTFILVIALFQLRQHLLIGVRQPLLLQFQKTPPGTLLRRGGEKHLQRGLRQYPGADVPAVHQHGLFRGQAPLQRYHGLPDAGVPRHGGGRHAYLRRANQAGDILALYQGMLCPAGIADINTHLFCQRGYGFLLRKGDPLPEGI